MTTDARPGAGDDHRQAAQLRPPAQLDRHVERVHVEMGDAAAGHLAGYADGPDAAMKRAPGGLPPTPATTNAGRRLARRPDRADAAEPERAGGVLVQIPLAAADERAAVIDAAVTVRPPLRNVTLVPHGRLTLATP